MTKYMIKDSKDKNISQKMGWINNDNAPLYEAMPIEFFENTAKIAGLNDGHDVSAAISYIQQAKSILEIGAGYGRVLEHIIQTGYQGELVAIERNQKLCDMLREKFSSKKATIYCADVQSVNLTTTFDLILWMWTGICEFSPKEQLKTLSILTAHLNKNGYIIIDIIDIECKTIRAMKIDTHVRIAKTPFGNDYGYFPSHDELETYRKILNLSNKEIIHYKTSTNKEKILYVFQKPG